jgi:hypothetical protein
MLKTSAFAIAGAMLGSFLSVSAWALPAAPLDTKAASDVILAADGCGRGFHRGPFGHCRPNEWPHRICPFGWHFAPFWGRCVLN